MRLFDRIRTPGRPVERKTMDTGDLVRSVVDHLRRLLNSRQGTTLMDEAYGLPDFTDLRATYPDSVRDIEGSIGETILRYEPRVRDVNVEFVFQDLMNLTLYFQINAVLETDHDDVTIVLESTMDAGGKMVVRG